MAKKVIYTSSDGTSVNLSTVVVDNLTSTSTTDALSANQGKVLKAAVDGKSSSGHTHDNRYYTETEMNTKLSAKAESKVLATDSNLNTVTTPGIYSCGGGNSITNKPSGVDAIGLIVVHNASGNYYTQILTTSSNANTYRRTCTNGTWGSWSQDKYTDTNTWRGIQNNLTSDSTTDSLSAAQGKVLKTAVDGKAPSSHTHNYAGSSSAGGAATSANKLNTNAGSTIRPVYFSNGIPVQASHTVEADVPENAKFTDTVTTVINGLGSTSSTAALSAAQGKVLNDAMMKKPIYSTKDLTPGVSDLADGQIYIVYYN